MVVDFEKIGTGQYPQEPINVTEQNINSVTNRFRNVVIDCWAPWCGPCRAISPTIDTLAKELHGDVVFGKMNTDKAQQIAMSLGVRSLPTLLVFKDGQLKERIVGSHNKKEISKKIKKVL